MDDGAAVSAEHADVVEGFDTASGVHHQQGQQVGGQGMDPVLGGADLGAGLIGMHNRFVAEAVFDLGDEGTSFPAASSWTWHSHPVDTGAPNTSANNSAVRSTGRCCRSDRNRAKDRTWGPQHTGALAA